MQAEKHLHIRQVAEQKYLAMLERACKLLVEQMAGCAVTNPDGEDYQVMRIKTPNSPSHLACGVDPLGSTDVVRVEGSEEFIPQINPHGADCSAESCLTSHDSPAGVPLEGSPPGDEGKKRLLSMETASTSMVRGESNLRTSEVHLGKMNSLGISGHGL